MKIRLSHSIDYIDFWRLIQNNIIKAYKTSTEGTFLNEFFFSIYKFDKNYK